MVIIEHLLQPAASAISEVVSDLLLIISQIITSWENASRGAIMVIATLVKWPRVLGNKIGQGRLPIIEPTTSTHLTDTVYVVLGTIESSRGIPP
jgi:hypothetical protein